MKEIDAGKKALIKKARKDQSIMGICYHEYLGSYGKYPPEGWQPSDEEVLAVIERIEKGIERNMENIEDKKFLTRELAIMTLRSWAKEHGKKPTQEELEDCIDVYWEEDGKWMFSNMDEFKDNLPVGAYYGITNYLEDIDE